MRVLRPDPRRPPPCPVDPPPPPDPRIADLIARVEALEKDGTLAILRRVEQKLDALARIEEKLDALIEGGDAAEVARVKLKANREDLQRAMAGSQPAQS